MLLKRYKIEDVTWKVFKQRYIQIRNHKYWPVDSDQSIAFLIAIDNVYVRNVAPLLLRTRDIDRVLGLALLCAFYFTDETYEIPFVDKCAHIAAVLKKTRRGLFVGVSESALQKTIQADGEVYLNQLHELVHAQLLWERDEISLAEMFGQFQQSINAQTELRNR